MFSGNAALDIRGAVAEVAGSVDEILKKDSFMPVEHTTRDVVRKISAAGTETRMVPLDRIVCEPGFNPRLPRKELDEHIEWLAGQILNNGFDQGKPLIGFFNGKGEFVATDGHCRRAATLLAVSRGADITALPCLPEDKSFTEEDRILSVFHRNEGLRLSPLEAAINLKRLRGFNMDAQAIADKIGKSITYVENLLLLAGAPRAIRDMVMYDKVAANVAVEAIKKDGASKAITTLQAALTTAVERGKQKAAPRDVRRISLGLKTSVDWKKTGPKLLEALRAIQDAENEEMLMHCISQSRALTKSL